VHPTGLAHCPRTRSSEKWVSPPSAKKGETQLGDHHYYYYYYYYYHYHHHHRYLLYAGHLHLYS